MRFGLSVLIALVFSTSGFAAQRVREISAWEQLLQRNPAAADDDDISWRDRLVLHVLTADQADDYFSGRISADQLRLASGETLAAFLERRLSPRPGLFVALPVPCRLFSLQPDLAETAVWARGADLSAQGGSSTGCGIPARASALLLRIRSESGGLNNRLKLWPSDLPEPGETVLETMSESAGRTTALVPLCDDCETAELLLRSSEPAVLQGEILGYVGTQPTGGGGIAIPFGPRDALTEGADNNFFGTGAGSSNTTGNENSFFGAAAGEDNTSGDDNSFFGSLAGNANTGGNSNAFFGKSAGFTNTNGGGNSFFGAFAGNVNTIGINNTAIGFGSGLSNTTENGNTFLGADSNGSAAITNGTAVGFKAQVSQSNSLVLGSINGLNAATSNTKVGIGTDTPDEALHVHRSNGTANLLVEETSATTSTRIMFSLVNNGGPFFNLVNSANGAQWSFAQNALGSFQFTALGTGGPEFLIRQDGTVQMGPGGTVNFELQAGGDLLIPNGMVMDASHSSLKKDFERVSAQEILDKVLALELSTWRYKAGERGRHLGPMAEDFHRVLGLGEDERSIAALDAAGVSLAAIQGLYERLSAKESEIEELKAELAGIRALLEQQR